MIEVNRKALLSALDQGKAFMARKPTPGWQSMCVIEAGGGSVRVTTTDGIARAVIKVAPSLETEAPFAVSLSELRSKLALVSGENARIKVEKDRVEVACGAGKYKLGKLDPSEFPSRSDVVGEKRTIAVASIRGAIEATMTAADTDEETRPHLSGVYLDGDDMAATDGRRVHKVAAKTGGASGLLPKRIAQWILSRGEGDVALTFAIGQTGKPIAVMAEHDGSAVMTGLPANDYPPYRQVAEPYVKGATLSVQCPTSALAEALRAVDTTDATGNAHGASVTVEGDELVLRTVVGDSATCPADGEVAEGLHVSPSLMLAALAVVAGDVTQIRTKSNIDGIVISDPGIDVAGSYAIVMPKRGS